MAVQSVALRLTHTGLSDSSVLIDDLVEDSAERIKPGPLYISPGASIELAFTGSVHLSYETGAIRTFIDGGHLTSTFLFGAPYQDNLKVAVGLRTLSGYPSQTGVITHYAAATVTNGGFIRWTLGRLPSDFTELVSVIASIRTTNTTTAVIQRRTIWASQGELWNANGETDTTTTYAVTVNQILDIELVDLFTGVSAGDSLGFELENNLGTTFYSISATAYFR